MKEISLKEIMDTGCFDNVLKIKLLFIRRKKSGDIFYRENMSKLPYDQPFEFYFHATKGSITYQNAFPIPTCQYKRWMGKEITLQNLLPYYQMYYETDGTMDLDYSLSHYNGEKYIWFYKEGVNYES
ncbi:hypothetical protein [Bacillus sp. FJAT-49736]|uniref:hypothetical protein n=1 Tax=Bacillus sp. FJAT-49736 TaxID=2833582 RepID=UPI001BC9D435|nr:hypothetical protein [Bacillus sp. FJAT-49736]MBS4171814.1 hypothetical protein [Bacillus sp. FJAT-49736]